VTENNRSVVERAKHLLEVMAIFASVRNRASSKKKMVRPSVELEDRVILLNCIYDLIEQKVTWFVLSQY
jgi:hypothetical protein